EEELLKRWGIKHTVLDSGCCGMAGSFGFEPDHYEGAIGVRDRVLLSKVREVSPETLIVTDGFSCREQIRQCTDRDAMHIAEVIEMAAGSKSSYPNQPAYVPVVRVAATLIAAATLIGSTIRFLSRRIRFENPGQ